MPIPPHRQIDHAFIETHAARLLDEVTELAAAEGASELAIPMTPLSAALCYAQLADARPQVDLLYQVLRDSNVHAERPPGH